MNIFFLELEAKRAQDLRLQKSGLVVIDRSIYTLLAFEAGASRLTGIDIFNWAVETMANQNDIIVPNHVVYMNVNTKVSRQRATEGNIKIADFLFSEVFNSGFRNFFDKLKQGMLDYVTIVDASQKQTEVCREIEVQTSSLTK